ncbi:hypothetical protein P0136_08395 [Lentisphaerota bacterium ZTH]|nr:hypothetical protein JYG24_00495 [Lentisphaerota bacterium]WET05384.1 hypothetical protein P0136_08395 [Lentisphaerota bacterium ZTH]
MKRMIITVIVLIVAVAVFFVMSRRMEQRQPRKPEPALAVQDDISTDAALFVTKAVETFQTKGEAEFMKLWGEVPPEQYAGALKCIKRGKGEFQVERVMQQQNSSDVFYVDGRLNTTKLEFVIRKTEDGFKIENVYEMM